MYFNKKLLHKNYRKIISGECAEYMQNKNLGIYSSWIAEIITTCEGLRFESHHTKHQNTDNKVKIIFLFFFSLQ